MGAICSYLCLNDSDDVYVEDCFPTPNQLVGPGGIDTDSDMPYLIGPEEIQSLIDDRGSETKTENTCRRLCSGPIDIEGASGVSPAEIRNAIARHNVLTDQRWLSNDSDWGGHEAASNSGAQLLFDEGLGESDEESGGGPIPHGRRRALSTNLEMETREKTVGGESYRWADRPPNEESRKKRVRKKRPRENQDPGVRRAGQPAVRVMRRAGNRRLPTQPSETRKNRWVTGRCWKPALLSPTVKGKGRRNSRYRRRHVLQDAQKETGKRKKLNRCNP